jgi:hypothetical protein
MDIEVKNGVKSRSKNKQDQVRRRRRMEGVFVRMIAWSERENKSERVERGAMINPPTARPLYISL